MSSSTFSERGNHNIILKNVVQALVIVISNSIVDIKISHVSQTERLAIKFMEMR